jgi:hypothetical protein
MRFFRSRVLQGTIGGHFFVTSEQFDANSPRLYTVRYADDSGAIHDASAFQAFKYPYQARKHAKELAAQDWTPTS